MPIREDIYLGPGYHVIRGFLTPYQARHLVDFWSAHHNRRVRKFNKVAHPFPGCPDYSVLDEDGRTHHLFLWNRTRDPFTGSVAWELQALRNRIEGHPAHKDFLPFFRDEARTLRAVSCRIAGTRQGGGLGLHRDFPRDHARIQMSLQLTGWGQDYEDGGLLFRKRGGDLVLLNREEGLRAGDLLLFRYSNEHAVAPIRSGAGQRGHWRILMPLEAMAPAATLRRAAMRLRARLRRRPPGKPAAERYYEDAVVPLMDQAIREGMEPSAVFFHKGLFARWREHQEWQFEMLLEHGLKPHHHVLDVGCGVLRLGLPLVEYLDDDRYCGIDVREAYIRLGHRYLHQVAGTAKRYHLLCDDGFRFDRFGRAFDFAIAHSVFTHLSQEQIAECLRRLKGVMRPDGIFLWTILLGRREAEDPFIYDGDVPMTRTVHRDASFFERLAAEIGFEFRFLGRERHTSQYACWARF